MRAEGASSARASVRWLRRRPSPGCTQSGSAGPAAAAAAAAARPGAALGLAVPRRSSRRGGRRGASERWAGRHCRSPSGRGRAASEKAPPGACARVFAPEPRARPPAPRAGRVRQPGPGRPSQRRAPGSPCSGQPAPLAHTGRSRERCESTREKGARLASAPSSAGRASASLGPEAVARGADSAATRLAPRPAAPKASGRTGPKRRAEEEPGWREANRSPRHCEGKRDEQGFTLCRGDEFMTFGVHPEGRGRKWLKNG